MLHSCIRRNREVSGAVGLLFVLHRHCSGRGRRACTRQTAALQQHWYWHHHILEAQMLSPQVLLSKRCCSPANASTEFKSARSRRIACTAQQCSYKSYVIYTRTTNAVAIKVSTSKQCCSPANASTELKSARSRFLACSAPLSPQSGQHD
jgi:hypothetical protein